MSGSIALRRIPTRYIGSIGEIPLLMNFPMEHYLSEISNYAIIVPYSSAHSVMSAWKPFLISCVRSIWAGRKNSEIRSRVCQSLDRERQEENISLHLERDGGRNKMLWQRWNNSDDEDSCSLIFKKILHLVWSDVVVPRLTTSPTWVLSQRFAATHTYCQARLPQRKCCVGEMARVLVSEKGLSETLAQSKTRVFRVYTQVD